MVKYSNKEWIQKLKNDVENHPVLKNPWIISQKEKFQPEAFYLWLTQEYRVSVAFVDWFLMTALKTNNQEAKIVLVQNIWEELGEGKIEETHVSILNLFLKELNISKEHWEVLPTTIEYLNKMNNIIQKSFFHGLGALGPANEYLLKKEYYEISLMYSNWKKDVYWKQGIQLPEPKFFETNLNADEGHAARLFELISKIAISPEEKDAVEEGNFLALEAREIFYKGLQERLIHLPIFG